MARAEPEKIEAARAYAKKAVHEFLANEPPRGEVGPGPVAYYFWWHYSLSWADGPHGRYIRVSELAAAILCRAALEDADVRELVTEIIASRVNNDMSLTNDLKDFAFLALKKRLPKPKTKPGTKVSKNFERDMFIIWTLSEIERRFDVSPTEGDYRGHNLPPNGSGILAECFSNSGRHEVTVRAVQKVWLNKKKRQKSKLLNEALANYKEPSINSLTDLMVRVPSYNET